MTLLDITSAYIFLLVIAVVSLKAQYEKYSQLQDETTGLPVRDLSGILLELIPAALMTGLVCTALFYLGGVSLGTEAVRYLFYAMCLLLVINLRFVCISNAAGILSIICLAFGLPGVDIPSLLIIAAVLHLIEGLLILVDSGKGSIPVFIEHKGGIAGAFLIRKFWLVPVVFFVSAGSAGLSNAAFALGIDCLVAFLAYSDLAISSQPEIRSRKTAVRILIYSLVLLAIAILSSKLRLLMYLGAFFCIAAHEAIYRWGKIEERKGAPLFKAAGRGLRVMEVLPRSHAGRMGIKRGDVILRINGVDIQSDESIREALKEYPAYTWIDVTGWDGKARTYEYRCYPDGYNALGIISVPRETEVTYGTDTFEHLSIIKNIVSRFRSM